MKRFILTFICFTLLFSARMLGGDGDWHIYSAYHNATKVVELGGVIYVLSDGNLYSYDPEDTYVSTYDKAGVLSDFGIFDIMECASTKELVVVYKNGNVDLLSESGDVFNMPDLKLKSLSDKTINDAVVIGSYLYISTNSGIVSVNVDNRSFGDYYNFGKPVLSTVVLDGKIICSTKSGPYRGNMSSNLLDPKNWEAVGGTSAYDKYRLHDGVIYCVHRSSLAYVSNVDRMSFQRILNVNTVEMCEANGRLFFTSTTGNLYELESPTSYKMIKNDYGILSVVYSSSTYWCACQTKGLVGLSITGDEVSEKVSSVIPNSPLRNYSYKLNMIDNHRLLVAGGTFNYTSGSDRPGTIMVCDDGNWDYFDETPLDLYTYLYYRNAIDVVQDPNDANHHFVSTARSGLYEFQDFKFVKRYAYDNSPLKSILPDSEYPMAYVRVSGLQYDSQNNLWMCNTEVDTIINIKRADGSWRKYYVPEIAGNPTFDHIIFDNRGLAWINSRRGLDEKMRAGFLAINTNGDPGNPKGFSHRFVTTFNNQDGTSYAPTLMNCMCFDHDGALWLGYEVGLFVSYNPYSMLQESGYPTLTQVKVPRNDGTNLADYLLSGVPIKCITVDGGNRKWIGTEGQGVYLISADGLETIAHFTKDTSPLVDNDVYDIKINGETGEVFFATNGGLCSYMGDATDPVASFDKDLVMVYPNPVGPDYTGSIVIRGLKYNSNVKIVNASGRLVNEGTSVGGEYKWDGCLQNRKRCGSGIYYILASDEGGKNGVVGKFLIVR